VSGKATVWEVRVAEASAGLRLDKWLAETAAREPPEGQTLSRARLQGLIADGQVRRAGEAAPTTTPRTLTVAGETWHVTLPEPVAADPTGEAIPLVVVHEDKDLIVIDKPAGLVVHPAAGHARGTLVNALIAHCGDSLSGIGGVRRPGIVHRLDKDTSGLLVIAKTDAAHQHLAAQFASHGADGRLNRRYVAFVWGAPDRPTGRIAAALARSRTQRTKMAVVRDEAGRAAATQYQVEARYGLNRTGAALACRLRLTLETGRTHQIRVHLAHIGHPVMGDPTYGTSHRTSAAKLPIAAQAALAALNRQALHAAELGFEHPRSGKLVSFRSALPADMARLAASLEG
jgi:23S rRNA pseudouridine1911/1915/1917 synthase